MCFRMESVPGHAWSPRVERTWCIQGTERTSLGEAEKAEGKKGSRQDKRLKRTGIRS